MNILHTVKHDPMTVSPALIRSNDDIHNMGAFERYADIRTDRHVASHKCSVLSRYTVKHSTHYDRVPMVCASDLKLDLRANRKSSMRPAR